MADGKGFEPSKACTLHAFQACSFNRSDTHLNKSRDYSENLKFCQIPFRLAIRLAFKFKTRRLEFYRAACNFAVPLKNSVAPLSQAALRFLAERRFYLAAAILKFRLSLKLEFAARRGAKFKKRKQIFLSYIRLRHKSRAAL